MTETIEITNFGGRLTRINNGDLNSGFAKFDTSFGYDPFTKPMNLTWLSAPEKITSGISDLILAAKPRNESNITFIYAVGNTGNFYKIQSNSVSSPNFDSVIGVSSVTSNGNTYTFGASIEFFGNTEKVYVGGDKQVNSINFDGSGDTVVGQSIRYSGNVYRPLKAQFGKLYFGNRNTIGAIDSTETVISPVSSVNGSNIYSELNPPLPPEMIIQDIEPSIDGNYLFILASNIVNEQVADVSYDRRVATEVSSGLFSWNGVDKGITAFTSIPGNLSTAMQTYLNQNIFFTNDSFGASINDGTQKIFTLTNNKSPLPNAVTVTSNFISWVSPEITNQATSMVGSMYYFGSLDQENPPGLYRMFRLQSSIAGGFIYQTPCNIIVSNSYQSVNNAITSIITFGYGKHYFSVYDVQGSTNVYSLFRFVVSPSGTGTPQRGVYETQTQLFSKRITVKQIRVYTEPTVSGNGFTLDCIGSDGKKITNGSFSYTFTSGTDITQLQGSLEMISFNPSMKSTYALGLRITNTGSTNMTIQKIEIDYDTSGK